MGMSVLVASIPVLLLCGISLLIARSVSSLMIFAFVSFLQLVLGQLVLLLPDEFGLSNRYPDTQRG